MPHLRRSWGHDERVDASQQTREDVPHGKRGKSQLGMNMWGVGHPAIDVVVVPI